MIIKEQTQPESDNKRYEIYEEVPATSVNGSSVMVLQLSRSITKSELEANISNLDNQIKSLEAQIKVEQAVLAEIDKL